MSLELVLLGLISLHPNASGYDLNQIMNNRTQNFLSVALSHIYPALNRLFKKGFVTYEKVALKNRPDKKMYQITPEGEQVLQSWLREPIESRLDMNPFFLKMSFSPLMEKGLILSHIDREIEFRHTMNQMREEGISKEIQFIDQEKFNLAKTEFLWQSITDIHIQTEDLRLTWLIQLRSSVEENLDE